MHKVSTRIIPLILLCTLLSACKSTGEKEKDPQLAKIKQGVTTRTEVLEILGQPEKVTHDGIGRTTFYYRQTAVKKKKPSIFSTFDSFTMDDFDDSVVNINTIYFGPDDVVSDLKCSTITSNIKDQLNN